MKRHILISIFYFLFSISVAGAAIWEDIPALPQAQRIKQEEIMVNNSPAQTTIYSTLATPQEIVEFYKTKLINFGWKLEGQTSQQGIEVLMFSKGDKLLNIMVQNILGKNFITLAQSIKPEGLVKQGSPCPECEKLEAEIKKKLETSKEFDIKEMKISEGSMPKTDILPKDDAPGKDLQFIPRYPGAVRVNNVERNNGKKTTLAYYTQASVGDVLDFYRQNMSNNYWNLEKEIDFQNLPEALTKEINIDIKGKSLVFKSQVASCIITVTEEPQNKATIIGVNYNEK
ncbi:MAG: hypothetical protein M0R66_03280 [Candidatus Omnitrophica bacterium]|nr:hypothetical protein [Candidatus Omnitrophota bacterium]